ncbi:hypothetical protein [Sulfuricaulis sp.]|jgi:hypothetical protein|uniref:hypothetical protein n=1 Tax=Sulfuricaulis sp. TaxID=2003553 RepID=UPI00355A8BF9
MQWLTDLIKHITISKILAGALFITSSILLWGSKILPAIIDPTPQEWRWFILCIFIFSLSLLVLWSVIPVYRFFRGIGIWVVRHPLFNTPSQIEEIMLDLIGRKFANDWLDLNNPASQDSDGISKLELLALSKSLEKKGLLEIYRFDEDRVRLTPRGRNLALTLIQKQKT